MQPNAVDWDKGALWKAEWIGKMPEEAKDEFQVAEIVSKIEQKESHVMYMEFFLQILQSVTL